VTIRFVIPWYGDIPGGAERKCRRTAEELAARGHRVEAWTTTIREFASNWNIPYHPEGSTETNGVTVRRFRADVTDHTRFISLNQKVLAGATLDEQEERDFLAHSVNSRRLVKALSEEPAEATFVIPYCFGLTVQAAYADPARTWMIPCFHDEGYARFRIYGDLFPRLAGLVLHTRAEADLISELHPTPAAALRVLGEGVNVDLSGDRPRFIDRYDLPGRPLLYLGRKDEAKNAPELLRFFGYYRTRYPDSPLRLVMVGPGGVDIPTGLQPWVNDLGFIPREDVLDALAAAELLVQPSLHESFSLVLMESWTFGKPALVNAGCEVTRQAVEAADGGLWYEGYPLFEAALQRLERDEGLRAALGEQGRRYVTANFTWPRIVERYEALLASA
jgi:glycosyltransferase involved in cell wall biosynthesis